MPQIDNKRTFTAVYTAEDIKELIMADLRDRTGIDVRQDEIEVMITSGTTTNRTECFKVQQTESLPIASPVRVAPMTGPVDTNGR